MFEIKLIYLNIKIYFKIFLGLLTLFLMEGPLLFAFGIYNYSINIRPIVYFDYFKSLPDIFYQGGIYLFQYPSQAINMRFQYVPFTQFIFGFLYNLIIFGLFISYIATLFPSKDTLNKQTSPKKDAEPLGNKPSA
jgi:hypothetical protein